VRAKTILATCAVLYFLSQVLFLVNIQFPRGYDFDEFHYVPSAKQFLQMKENQNWEHPPLGKEIMAASIALWGDRPIGWRFLSTVFGSLTLVAFYLWGLALFKSQRAALLVAGLTAVNSLLYVQARIGMLDTFMFCFTSWGLAAFTFSWNPENPAALNRRLLIFTGLMMGLATATKWSAVIPWILCLGLILLIRLLQYWKTSFGPRPSPDDWYHVSLWKGIRVRDFLLWLVALPLLVYFIPFIPLLYTEGSKKSFWDLFTMQKKMWEGQLRVVTAHPYMSTWPDWPLLKRPIWYAFDKEGEKDAFVRGVILLGNPLIMWSGVLAVLLCLRDWIAERRREAFLITAFYAALYLCWIIIPRKVSFYYYYYPAGMTLSLALAYVFHRAERTNSPKAVRNGGLLFLLACLALFIYFFPILAALRIQANTFQNWMWFRSWI